MNVIQVLSYMRFFSAWPAALVEVFLHLDNAITLKPISDPLFEYGQTQFDKTKDSLKNEEMQNAGI